MIATRGCWARLHELVTRHIHCDTPRDSTCSCRGSHEPQRRQPFESETTFPGLKTTQLSTVSTEPSLNSNLGSFSSVVSEQLLPTRFFVRLVPVRIEMCNLAHRLSGGRAITAARPSDRDHGNWGDPDRQAKCAAGQSNAPQRLGRANLKASWPLGRPRCGVRVAPALLRAVLRATCVHLRVFRRAHGASHPHAYCDSGSVSILRRDIDSRWLPPIRDEGPRTSRLPWSAPPTCGRRALASHRVLHPRANRRNHGGPRDAPEP